MKFKHFLGSEVHNLMLDPSMDGRSGISFKLLSQQMRLGNDVVDDVTRWVALNDETGVISVAKSVDREEYCNADKNKPCVVHVKVGVAMLTFRSSTVKENSLLYKLNITYKTTII